ncbi:hypothetical protein HOLleu_17116 [Holothuria leucospilota]|uniref:Uncharacterized protein n=1 Tax=Holothuria leucospilota TaxID=206669 RepID=A0A9Q1C699_HOLLE|nr:hypothetical protein HOLleu_17116 [Holothuria leucospilota]
MDQLMDGFTPQDRVGIELSAPSWTHAVWVPLVRRDQQINFESMRQLLPTLTRTCTDEKAKSTVHYPKKIQRLDPGTVVSKSTKKDYRLVYTKRTLGENYTTTTYGF